MPLSLESAGFQDNQYDVSLHDVKHLFPSIDRPSQVIIMSVCAADMVLLATGCLLAG